MTVVGTCPECGASAPLAAFLADAEGRRAFAAALALPAPLAELIPPYIALHAPAGRRMAWGKLARLLDALRALIDAGTVTRHGETRPAPLAQWAEGLTEVLAQRDAGKLRLPLTGHGLLAEIVFARAQTAARAAAAERPLHPSHLPIERPGAVTPRPVGEHIRGLRQALKGANDSPPDPVEEVSDGPRD